MRTAGFPNFYVDDPKTQRALEDLRHVMKPVMENEMMIGRRIEVIFKAAELKEVRHGLGRVPVGWTPWSVRVKGGDPAAWCSDVKWDRETITFQSSGACTLIAWVF